MPSPVSRRRSPTTWLGSPPSLASETSSHGAAELARKNSRGRPAPGPMWRPTGRRRNGVAEDRFDERPRTLSGNVKIAILGTRGIPASYSGFETAVEQLAWRLSDRGHEVVVYCRPHVVDRTLSHYRGAQLVHLRTIQNKYLDTFVHTFRSAVHAARVTKPDVALFFIAG